MHANDGAPTVSQLEGAPVLTNWSRVRFPVRGFVGIVSGHPRFGSNKSVSTSQVWTEGNGWVRTLSRFYLLSDPENGSNG
ncbi:hypothetical protein ACFQI3_10365 [Hansschlegelia quercus]|uniref:hypothetical protein n=1 Tax=Hansschlegelia quercus TaxID=2528245 RepID=UPI00360F7036